MCQASPEAVLELSADGALIAMTPTGGETSSRNGQLLFELQVFCRRYKGWRLFDSSGGFRLPDGSVLSPDAALVLEERWLLLPQERAAEIWRGGRQGRGQRLENASRLDGSELAEGRSDHGWRLNEAASQWLREVDGAMTTGTREPPRLALPRHWMNQH